MQPAQREPASTACDPDTCVAIVSCQVVHPGEVLFVPGGTPHAVENLTDSLAVAGAPKIPIGGVCARVPPLHSEFSVFQTLPNRRAIRGRRGSSAFRAQFALWMGR